MDRMPSFFMEGELKQRLALVHGRLMKVVLLINSSHK
jgi:hypothetical protein